MLTDTFTSPASIAFDGVDGVQAVLTRRGDRAHLFEPIQQLLGRAVIDSAFAISLNVAVTSAWGMHRAPEHAHLGWRRDAAADAATRLSCGSRLPTAATKISVSVGAVVGRISA
jgi:hypothetical protein